MVVKRFLPFERTVGVALFTMEIVEVREGVSNITDIPSKVLRCARRAKNYWARQAVIIFMLSPALI